MSDYASNADIEEVIEEVPQDDVASNVDEAEEAPEEPEEDAADEEADDEPKDDEEADADEADADADADGDDEDKDDEDEEDKPADDEAAGADGAEKKKKATPAKKGDAAKSAAPKPAKSLYVKPAKALSRREVQKAQKDYKEDLETFLQVTVDDLANIVNISLGSAGFRLDEDKLAMVTEKAPTAEAVTAMFPHIRDWQLDLVEYFRHAGELNDEVRAAIDLIESYNGRAISADNLTALLTIADKFPDMLPKLAEHRAIVMDHIEDKCIPKKRSAAKAGASGKARVPARASRLTPRAKAADHESAAFFQMPITTSQHNESAQYILASNIKF